MERIIDFIKRVKNFFLAWDYYGRGKPLPHNDVVKQKRLVKSKLKRALSVFNVIQRSEQSPLTWAMFATWNPRHGAKIRPFKASFV
ncbi:MAG TPA: hypothetical protein DIV38_00460 [Clostridiales bacterium]|nr:hypothetical protein [Clostridiales bacterium]